MPPDSSHQDTEYTETPLDVVLSHHMIKASWVPPGKGKGLNQGVDSMWQSLEYAQKQHFQVR